MPFTTGLETISIATSTRLGSPGIEMEPTFIYQIMEFISKIGQIVLRARVGLSPEFHRDINNLIYKTEFWRNGMPVNYDIFMTSSKILLERWVVSFEPSEKIHNEDMTDLILMVQSLYSHVRLMPVHSQLAEGTLSKSHLGYTVITADGHQILPADEPEDLLVSSGFDLTAKLKVYKFRTAVASFGKLHLSVVYDANISSLIPSKLAQPVVPISFNARKLESPDPVIVINPPLTSPLRNSNGSPFPSPRMTKRILNLAHLNAKNSSTLSSIPKSSLQLENTEDLQEFDDDHARTTKPPLPPHESSPVSVPAYWLDQQPAPLSFNTESNSSELRINIPTRKSTPLGSPHPISHSPIKLQRSSYGDFLSYASSGGRRRESINSELFGSLVGSYEESILSGRMSTLPSKPISFIAEIGVIAIGKCKPQLKCPPHINLTFPAYFYDMVDSEVSTPYVGVIDVENLSGLTIVQRDAEKRDIGSEEYHAAVLQRKEEEELVRKNWPGGYRLPMRGQLQIIIKNPSKTAVKVFLVPYDFRDMPPNSKTFLRQKSYTKCSTTSPSRTQLLNDRLRYAIHLQFICTPKKRLLLSKNIRIVFSPRAPDSDEKLRVVCEGPKDPKYTPIVELPQQPQQMSASYDFTHSSSYSNYIRRQSPLWNSGLDQNNVTSTSRRYSMMSVDLEIRGYEQPNPFAPTESFEDSDMHAVNAHGQSDVDRVKAGSQESRSVLTLASGLMKWKIGDDDETERLRGPPIMLGRGRRKKEEVNVVGEKWR